MARDIEDTLTTRLTLLFNERYGLPEAVTQSFAGGKFLDVFVPLEGVKVVVEAKKGQATLRRRQAARDADKRLRAGHADVAFALCYPDDATLASLPTDTLTWQIRQDPDVNVPWREGTAADLAREIRLAPQQVDQTNLAARILSNALDDAVALLNARERELIARELDLPPKRVTRKSKDGKERAENVYDTAAKRGLLVVAVAMLFHFRLRWERRPEGYVGPWPPASAAQCLSAGPGCASKFDEAWELILRVDYRPIFETARKALASLPPYGRMVESLARAIEECSQRTTGSRHDLAGRIFHRVLDSARYDGSYYTSIAAATLLAELAIEEESAADPLSLRVCDPACGTGTLLMTAAARLRDLRPAGVNEAEYDRRLVEDVLWGYDINLTATHLAATTLGMDSPSVKFANMNIHRALLGWHKLDREKRPYRVTRKSDNPETYIGSVGFIDGQQPLALWPTLAHHIEEEDTRPHHPPQADLVIMNPPFTRNDIRHDQFNEAEERAIKRKEREILSKTGALAAAGLHSSGGAFGVLGDWLVKRDVGTLAMVLPTVVLSGAANQAYRRFLARKFHIDLIVSIHDPDRVFFSENTGIGECLVIARRWDDRERGAKPPTRMINLARNPATRIDALRLAERIRRGEEDGDFTEQRIPPERIAQGDWFAANFLAPVMSEEYLALQSAEGFAPLGDMASIDPAGRAVRQHFRRSDMPTSGGRRALWHHKTSLRRSMLAHTDTHIAARTDDAGRYWDRRGRLLLPMKLALPLARVGAVIVSERTLGSLWTPAHPNDASAETEEAWALYLNSSVGLLALLGGRGNRIQVYPDFSMKALRGVRVPDLDAFPGAREAMASAFRRLQTRTLRAFPYLDADPSRREVDDAVIAALGLDPERVARIRRDLSREPSITDRRYGVPRENGDDEAEEAEADGAEAEEEDEPEEESG